MSELGDPVLSWSEIGKTPMPEWEVSTFIGVDTAVGNAIALILRGTQCNHPGKAFNTAKAFLERQPAEQIKRSPYTDPKQFLRAMRGGRIAELTKTPGVLPIIYFQRVPGHVVAEGDRYAPVRNWAELSNPATPDTPGATIHQHHVFLTYRIYVLAWEFETLDFITTTLSAWFRNHGRKLAYQTQLMGAVIPGSVDIMTNVLSWEDMSPGIDTDRLLCLSCTVEVTAEAFEAQTLETRQIRYVMLEPEPLFGEGDA